MNREAVISVNNVSKAFELYHKPIDLLYEFIGSGKRHDVYWALNNISFEVFEGQRVGIIGANGAGKSTLLRIITGNLSPTSGTVNLNGSISSMLSLNSSLNQEESGIENIKFNLQMKGIPSSELSKYVEEIIDFTELGTFIYSPVKTYSTGMNARLSFAISTVLTPDILLVDEVLSVGDGYFVGKATKRMLELCKRGRALLYVSHSLSALQMLCDTVIWLDKGLIRMQGPTEYVIKSYEEDYRRREDVSTREGNRIRDKKNAHLAQKEDFMDLSVWKLRIVALNGELFHDVHYIQSINLIVNDQALPISFNLEKNGPTEDVACLDILNSEWGRPFERNGTACIILTATTGKKRGGHILIRKPENTLQSQSVEISIEIVYSSEAKSDLLGVEFLDESSGIWKSINLIDVEKTNEQSLNSKWERKKFCGRINHADETIVQKAIQSVKKASRTSVEILEAFILVHGERSSVVRERTPFQVIIFAQVNRFVPSLDFGLRFMRADGVYAFWQTSSEASCGNVSAEIGFLEITFDFQPNLFAGGQYGICVAAANGFDPETNYPCSEVFDRKVNFLSLTVQREHEIVDYGLINQRVDVNIVVSKTVPSRAILEDSLA